MKDALRELVKPKLTHRLHVRLTAEEAAAIEELAAEYGANKTTVARSLLRLGLAAAGKEKGPPKRA